MDSSEYVIKLISAEETYAVRQPVLRARRPIEDCIFDGDTLETTFHFGLYHKALLCGVASFMKNKNDSFPEETQYQLRGMAILEDYQKKGLGKLLLHTGEEKLTKINVDRLWFNAREIALKFYRNHGYETLGNSFNIEGVGIHFLMTKNV